MTKDSWLTCTVQDFIDKGEAEVKTGPFGTQLHASDYVETGTPVINARNIGFGEMRVEKLEFISDETVQRLSSHLLEPSDIVFGRKGTVERHVFIQPEQAKWFQGTDCLRLRFKSPSIEPRFVSYCLLTEEHKQWIMNQSSHGATMTSLNQAIIGRISLQVPPLTIQRRIASILSAYDDLIENNTRRIRILEQMAQAIYREWFVEFRAPGVQLRKATSNEKKVTGKEQFPVGWEVRPLKDICEQINYGYTASAQREPIGPKFLRITDIVPYLIDWNSVPQCEIEEKDAGKYRLAEGDIVIARTGATTGYAKRLNKLHPEAVFASYLVRVRVKPEHSNRLIGLIVESDDYRRFIKANLGGAAQPQANAQVLTSIPVVIPPQSIQESFDRLVEDIFDQREVLQVKNANLRQTRDLLLPRLVGGEIAVNGL